MSKEELEWRLKTGEHRRNLWKFRTGWQNDQGRLKQLEDAYLKPKKEYRAAHEKELKAHKKGDGTVYGIEEAKAVLAARGLPVPTRTGKEQAKEEEEDAKFGMVVWQSLQPPTTGGGTHDVEARTSGAVRQPVVT